MSPGPTVSVGPPSTSIVAEPLYGHTSAAGRRYDALWHLVTACA